MGIAVLAGSSTIQANGWTWLVGTYTQNFGIFWIFCWSLSAKMASVSMELLAAFNKVCQDPVRALSIESDGEQACKHHAVNLSLAARHIRATSFSHTDTTVHSKVQGNSWVPVWNSKLAETKLQMHLVLDARLDILGDHALHFWSQSAAQSHNQTWNLLWLDSKFMVLPRRYTWDPLSKDLIVSNIMCSFDEMHYIPTNLISCDLCLCQIMP